MPLCSILCVCLSGQYVTFNFFLFFIFLLFFLRFIFLFFYTFVPPFFFLLFVLITKAGYIYLYLYMLYICIYNIYICTLLVDRKRNGEGYGINAFMGIGSPRHRRTENIALCNSINRVRESDFVGAYRSRWTN